MLYQESLLHGIDWLIEQVGNNENVEVREVKTVHDQYSNIDIDEEHNHDDDVCARLNQTDKVC